MGDVWYGQVQEWSDQKKKQKALQEVFKAVHLEHGLIEQVFLWRLWKPAAKIKAFPVVTLPVG